MMREGIRRGMPLPDNDPNGTRERAAGNVSGSAEIRLVDTSGRPLGRATAPLMQMQSMPNAAGTGP